MNIKDTDWLRLNIKPEGSFFELARDVDKGSMEYILWDSVSREVYRKRHWTLCKSSVDVWFKFIGNYSG